MASGQNAQGTKCPRDKMRKGQNAQGTKCPLGKRPIGKNAQLIILPIDQMTWHHKEPFLNDTMTLSIIDLTATPQSAY